jgi:dipeptidyl-peptidase 4
MTLMAMFKAGDIYVAGSPVTGFRLYDTHYTERYLSTPQKNPDGYDATAVFPYTEELIGDLLIYHGMADDNVLFVNPNVSNAFERAGFISLKFSVLWILV